VTRIFISDHAMSDDDCRTVQAAMDAGVREDAEILEESVALDADVRRAAHVEVADPVLAMVERCLDAQREAVGAFFGCSLRSREGVSLLRYEAGGFYRPHVDRAQVPSWPAAWHRTLTVVLFLNSAREIDPGGGFSGGLLRLLPRDAESIGVLPKRGRLVAFAADLPHEVTPVAGGRRDTVVDWFRERGEGG
jgi:predicted 2-oxoglutarate/Fe(II)-dependent dioxygenase YbiX